MDTMPPFQALRLVLGGLLALLVLAVGVAVDIRALLQRKRGKPPPLPPPPAVEGRPWTWPDVVLVVAALVISHSAAILLLRALEALGARDGVVKPLAIVLETFAFHGAGLVIVLGLLHRRRLMWQEAFGAAGRTLPQDFHAGLGYYLGALPPVIVTSLAAGALLYAMGYPIDEPQPVIALFRDPATPGWLVFFVLVVAVTLAPLVEELLFRGILLPVFARQVGTRGAVLLVSAFFAFIHNHLASFAPLMAIAAIFSMAYLRTGSLRVPIIMHALFNGLNIALLFLIGDAPDLPISQ